MRELNKFDLFFFSLSSERTQRVIFGVCLRPQGLFALAFLASLILFADLRPQGLFALAFLASLILLADLRPQGLFALAFLASLIFPADLSV